MKESRIITILSILMNPGGAPIPDIIIPDEKGNHKFSPRIIEVLIGIAIIIIIFLLILI